MLEHALSFAQRDPPIAVFPVLPGKAPLTTHGFKDATTGERPIRSWWTWKPDASIGARCDWFFVADFDFGKGGEHFLAGWRRVRGEFPRTWTARTGSGGLHYYFAHDPALDAIPLGKLYDGVDIKGGGRGYVLLPPSRNTNGAYRWLVSPDDAPLAKAPSWLIDEIVRKKAPRVAQVINVDLSEYKGVDRVEQARRYARAIPAAVEGEHGDDATWITTNKIARGFSLSSGEAFNVLATDWNPRCKPPWDEKGLRRYVGRALALGTMPMGCLLRQPEKKRGAA